MHILLFSATSGLPQIDKKRRGCQWQRPEKISISTHGKSRTSSIFDRIHKTRLISHLFKNSNLNFILKMYSLPAWQKFYSKNFTSKDHDVENFGAFLEFEFSFIECSELRLFNSRMLCFQEALEEGVGQIC